MANGILDLDDQTKTGIMRAYETIGKLYQPNLPFNQSAMNLYAMMNPNPLISSMAGIAGLTAALPDNFKNLSSLDQQFIIQQAGGNRPMKDAFGYNIRSAFGNYGNLVGSRADIARGRQARGLALRAIDQYYLNKEKEKRALEEKAQREFLAAQNRGGDGPQNNPQGGLGRQDYSRAASADFGAVADELGIDY